MSDSVLIDELHQAAMAKHQARAQEYMLALQTRLVVGVDLDSIRHEHQQFYLRGLDLIEESMK